MPKVVDAEARKRQIVEVAIGALADGGYSALTLRSIAKKMGGSITLITHYFQNREELVRAILDQTIDDTKEILEELKLIEDPNVRLQEVLLYFLPLSESSMTLERARVALSVQRESVPDVAEFFVDLEPSMRRVLEVALSGYVSSSEVDQVVDLLRTFTAGVVLSAIEHPEIWTPARQIQALEYFLPLVNLPVPTNL